MRAAPEAPEALGERLQEQLEALEGVADPAAQARVEEIVGTMLEMYGAGLERILEIVDRAGEPGKRLKEDLAADGVVASLMLIHGLYPVGLAERVTEALDAVRPMLAAHEGDVELLEVSEDGVARLRLKGSCDGCPASAVTLENMIREAIDQAAPDLTALEVEGVADPPRPPGAPTLASSPPSMTTPKVDLPMVQVGAGGYTSCPSELRA